MEIDEDQMQSFTNHPISPVTTDPSALPDIVSHVWTNREGRLEHQDEDLFSRSPSPLSGLLETCGGQGLSDDDIELSEEEPLTSVHLPATQLLNMEFELQAARAGMCDCNFRVHDALLMLETSSQAPGSRGP
jgi:hypothetical protein